MEQTQSVVVNQPTTNESLPYNVFINKAKDNKLVIYIDQTNLRPPVSIFAGTGNKVQKYKTFLDTCFTTNTNLIDSFIIMHKNAIEAGEITLAWKKSPSKTLNTFMADAALAIKAFLETHQSTFTSLIRYSDSI